VEKPSLRAQLDALYSEYRKILPEGILSKMNAGNESVVASGVLDRCLMTGKQVPLFALPDARGKRIELDALLKKGPVVISFFRGSWCTFCSLELRALQACHAEIRTRGATLVAITPQLPEHTATSLDEMDISFPILNDCGNEVARRFGLTFTVDEELRPIYSKSFKIDLPKENGDQSYELPIPSTFVVAQDGRVCTAFNDPNYFRRLEPRAILEALDEL